MYSTNNARCSARHSSSHPDATDIVPKRFALKYKPPTVVLEYELKSTGKLYHYRVKLGRVRTKIEATAQEEAKVVSKICGKYERLLSPGLVSEDQVRRLVARLFAGIRSLKEEEKKEEDRVARNETTIGEAGRSEDENRANDMGGTESESGGAGGGHAGGRAGWDKGKRGVAEEIEENVEEEIEDKTIGKAENPPVKSLAIGKSNASPPQPPPQTVASPSGDSASPGKFWERSISEKCTSLVIP